MSPKNKAGKLATSVNIRPGVGIIGLFPHMNYKPWYALAELVDNALASYLASRDRLTVGDADPQLRIAIEVSSQDGGSIRVWDNAGGIAASDYRRAFVAADPPPDPTGLSQFGIGMKSACCWFARRWSVRSSALDEPLERRIEFDIPRIVSDSIEHLTASESAAPASDHFTELQLWDLYKPPQSRTIGKMADHLASIYRVFLARGDVEITFNGQHLAFEQPQVLTARLYDEPDADPVVWQKPVEFTLPTGESVAGFAGIRETGSVAKAGFALFRKDRLIVGSDDDSYRPAEIFGASNRFRYQRVFGELHLDGFDVSHTKDGFIWGDREDAFLERLRTELDGDDLPLLRQAEHYRSREPTSSQRQAGQQALESTARALEGTGPELTSQAEATPGPDELPASQPEVEQLASRSFEISVAGQAWEICVELSSDPAVTEWLSISSGPSGAGSQPRRLEIRVSLAHPFMLQFGGTTVDDIEPLLRVAAALALGEVTARESGVRMAGVIRRNVNDLLRSALAQP